MLKKHTRALVLLFLIIGIILGIGCGEEKASIKSPEDSLPTTTSAQASSTQSSSSELASIASQAQPQPQPQPQSTSIKPSEISSEFSTNTSGSLYVQKVQAVPILYYHSVRQEDGNELRMPPDQFEAQMAYLKDKGYNSISLEQLYQATYQGGALPLKPFVITLDDGYLDNYTIAFPILKRHGFTATIFMVTSYIDGEGFMSWSQLKELVANGWEIEGHTENHPHLTKKDPQTVLSELEISKELLENRLGQSVKFFAYPYGDLNANVVQVVKDAGYAMAFTTERGWADGKADAWHVHRIYCFAFMGMNEFARRLQNPNY